MSVLSRIRRILRKSALEVIPNVYQLTLRGANLILIAEDELTLIDTGFRGSSVHLIDFTQSLGRSVADISLIVLTHNHVDHAGGLAELKKLTSAKVAVHKADVVDAEAQPSLVREKRVSLRMLPFFALHSVFSVKLSEVDIRLTGGEVLKPLGGLEVIHTPGHTPGSISLFSPRTRLLIVGDALNRRRLLPPRIASTDLKQAIDSIAKMARIDFDIVCCGHGRPLTGDIRSKMWELAGKTKD